MANAYAAVQRSDLNAGQGERGTMIFDVLKATLSFSQQRGDKTRYRMNFDVVPQGREYLEIGDKYILAAAGYLPMRDQSRTPIRASVSVTSEPGDIEWVKGERPICGIARFFGDVPPKLMMEVAVEPDVLEQMTRIQIAEPGTATLHTDIRGLELGWEPDGSHQIWNLADESDCEDGGRRRITSFWLSVGTFATTEKAVQEADERKLNERLASSPDPEERKLAASTAPENEPPLAPLLRQCRAILIAILVVAVIALVRLSR